MKFKHKLTLAFVGVAIVPLVIVSGLTLSSASRTYLDYKFSQLRSLNEVKRLAVVHYLNSVINQTASMSKNPEVADSLIAFNQSFSAYRANNRDSLSAQKATLRNYYDGHFMKTLAEQAPKHGVNSQSLITPLSSAAVALQMAYIVDNPNPPGSKEALDQAPGNQRYDRIHGARHPYFRDYQQRFGYYDIFLINTAGDVIYSVFKEVDYATSLMSGPYAQSGLAQSFKAAMQRPESDPVAVVDFQQYLPSFQAPAAFTAAPVYADGEIIGVIALQFPIDQLNMIMAEREGLGETGETYLVGHDLLMRSDSYLNPTEHSVVASFANPDTGRVDTEATRAAFDGEKDTRIITDYNGNPVLSSFQPLGVEQFDWVILAEIDEQEVMANVKHLLFLTITLILVAIIFSLIVSFYFIRYISKILGGEPTYMAKLAARIADGDLTARINSQDSTGIYQSLCIMTNQLQTTVAKIAAAAEKQSSSAEELSVITTQASTLLDKQLENTQLVSTAMNQMSSSVADVSRSSANASESTKETRTLATNASAAMESSAQGILSAVNELETAKAEVISLNQHTESISTIMETIRGIAEQTNLLALNAAIEAARAGEQGRGFAVVADEVRSLAQNTQNSVGEISEMIETLQKAAENTVKLVNRSVEQVQSVSNSAMKTATDLGVAATSMAEVDDAVLQIASAAEEQASVAASISDQLEAIYNSSGETQSAAAQIALASKTLEQLSVDLIALVRHFRLP